MAPKKGEVKEPEPEPEPEAEPEPADKVKAELCWRHMSEEDQAEYFVLAEDPVAVGEHLSHVLALPEFKFDPREAVRIDYATHVLNFGRRIGLSPLRISTVFSISQTLLEVAVSGGTKAEAQGHLKNFLLGLCVAAPTPEDYKFNPDTVAQIGKFFKDGFLSKFKAFHYVFNFEQPRQETDHNLLVQTVNIRPNFHTAFIEEDWNAYHADLAAKAETERVAAEEARIAEEEKAKKLAEEQALIAAEARRREEAAKTPQSLDEAVNKLVAIRLTEEKQKLSATYKERETALLDRINVLEEQVAEAAPKKDTKGKKK